MRMVPASLARSPATACSAISTESTLVRCGTLSNSAIIAGNTPPVPSVDWLPAMARSNPLCRRAAASTSAVSPRSAPTSAVSTTCTARDAPIARAFRIVADAASEAIESTSTSVPGCRSA